MAGGAGRNGARQRHARLQASRRRASSVVVCRRRQCNAAAIGKLVKRHDATGYLKLTACANKVADLAHAPGNGGASLQALIGHCSVQAGLRLCRTQRAKNLALPKHAAKLCGTFLKGETANLGYRQDKLAVQTSFGRYSSAYALKRYQSYLRANSSFAMGVSSGKPASTKSKPAKAICCMAPDKAPINIAAGCTQGRSSINPVHLRQQFLGKRRLDEQIAYGKFQIG